MTTLTQPNTYITVGDYTVYNSVMSLHQTNTPFPFTQTVTFDSSSPLFPQATFNWQYPNTAPPAPASGAYAYAEVYWGRDWSSEWSGNVNNAALVSNINSLVEKYSVAISGETSQFDVMTEFYTFPSSASPDFTPRSRTTAEVMVDIHTPWSTYWQQNWPLQNHRTTIVDGIAADVYSTIQDPTAPAGTRTLVAVVLQTDHLTGTIDFGTIIKDLVAHNEINPADYIAGVELGSEVMHGTGSLTVNQFGVSEVLNSYTQTATTNSQTFTPKFALAETITGSSGVNAVVYPGKLAEYAVGHNNNGTMSVASQSTAPSVINDTLNNIQQLQFSDMTVNLSVQADAASIASTDLQHIEELYVAFFNRVPDANGLDYWITQFKGGTSLTSIADSFYGAGVANAATTGYTATLSNSDFVKLVYANVLGRTATYLPPSAADVSYWAGNLADGTQTHSSLVNTMLSAAHAFKGDPAWGWVPATLDNKVTVANLFAVTDGLSYNTDSDSITHGMAIAAAVTATDTSAAIGLIGQAAGTHLSLVG